MKLEKICKSFGDKEILKDFSLEIPDKSIVFLTGASGCGKTTLLKIIGGILNADSGTVSGAGKISYLFQEPRLLPWKTALENVSLVSDKKTAAEYLSLVGLEKELSSYPNELSGGQRQRIAIARALAFKSDTILLDEPFQNLDKTLHDRLVKSFLEIYLKEKRTVIWVSHDSEEETFIRNIAKDYLKISL